MHSGVYYGRSCKVLQKQVFPDFLPPELDAVGLELQAICSKCMFMVPMMDFWHKTMWRVCCFCTKRDSCSRGQMTVKQQILSVLGAKLDAVNELKSETWYAFQSRVDMIGRTIRTRMSIILFSAGPVPVIRSVWILFILFFLGSLFFKDMLFQILLIKVQLASEKKSWGPGPLSLGHCFCFIWLSRYLVFFHSWW